jgi:ornithine cyclodeaminase/alanine dehydrogenase
MVPFADLSSDPGGEKEMAWFFTEDEVVELLPMTEAVERIEEAFRLLGQKRAANQPRSRVRLGRLLLHVLSAGSEDLGYAGLKAYTTGPAGARFYVLLFDSGTGELVAMMQADQLGRIRTGAATAVATRHLAREEATRIGIYGTGGQAVTQLEAIAASRRVSEVRVYGRDPERRRAFGEEMEKRLGLVIRPAARPEEVAAESEILVTATSAREPVLFGEWLKPGHHVNAIGSNALNRREIDDQVVLRANVIAADSVDQAKVECGDLAPSIASGRLSWEKVHELSDIVVSGIARGAADITLFESQGIALEDVAAAQVVYEKGRKRGLGRELDL